LPPGHQRAVCFQRAQRLDYNQPMPPRRFPSLLIVRCSLVAAAVPLLFFVALAQQKETSTGRILLLPRTVVSGERATLAVLDADGRLTPGAPVVFSNGDHLTTDKTGRAMFVAPLNAGVIYGSLPGRPGRVPTTVLPAAGNVSTAMDVTLVPRVASLADRFEIQGHGFCGVADANQITVSGDPALVLAASPTSLLVLPPMDLPPGRASVDLSCGKQNGPPIEVVFVALDLKADSSPLNPGVHRWLTVQVRGTRSKVELEATNLAPDIAELIGGNPLRVSSSGGSENLARYEVVGRKRGNFLISIRLLAPQSHPD
jgi:hypothetical protein